MEDAFIPMSMKSICTIGRNAWPTAQTKSGRWRVDSDNRSVLVSRRLGGKSLVAPASRHLRAVTQGRRKEGAALSEAQYQ